MTTEILAQTARQLLAAGYDIIPIKPGTKMPVHNKWTTRNYTPNEIRDFLYDDHCNLGLRLGEHDLLIDIDIKNGAPGTLSWERLGRDVPELRNIAPMTETVSGGAHYLLRLPEDIDGKTLASHHEQYPGIDFLSRGQQVLIGGCEVEGRAYTPRPQGVALPAPAKLIEVLSRQGQITKVKADGGRSAALGWGILNPFELAEILGSLDPRRFSAAMPGDWFELMCSCHYVTAGQAVIEFIQWSMQDKNYTGEEDSVRVRWESLSDQKDRPITGWYLVKQLRAHGADAAVDLIAPQLQMVEALPDFEKITEGELVGEQKEVLTSLLARVAALPEKSDAMFEVYEILVALAAGKNLPLTDSAVIRAILEKFNKKFTKGDLEGQLKQIREDQPRKDEEGFTEDSYDRILVDKFVRAIGGRDAIVYSENWIWRWDAKSGHYRQTAPERVRQVIDAWLIKAEEKITQFRVTNMYNCLRDIQYVEPEFWNAPHLDHGGMINLVEAELWLVDGDAGSEWVLRPHTRKNRQRTALALSYDPSKPYKPPEAWLAYLASAFRKATLDLNSRRIAVGMIYTFMGSYPWLKKAWFLLGPPNTGKSKVIELFEDMIGTENKSNVSLIKLADRFSRFNLVGKLANFQAETTANDRVDPTTFKTVVSGDSDYVEQKGQQGFSFANRAVMWMAGNNLPKFATEGGSGVKDRLIIISYTNALKEENRSSRLLYQFKKEKDEILHWALRIYREEWDKDQCISILAAGEDDEELMDLSYQTQPYLVWMAECLDFDMEVFTTTGDLFNSYQTWQLENPQSFPVRNEVSFGRYIRTWLKEVEGLVYEKGRAPGTGQKNGYWGLGLKTLQ